LERCVSALPTLLTLLLRVAAREEAGAGAGAGAAATATASAETGASIAGGSASGSPGSRTRCPGAGTKYSGGVTETNSQSPGRHSGKYFPDKKTFVLLFCSCVFFLECPCFTASAV
jgi:hypothetical protein